MVQHGVVPVLPPLREILCFGVCGSLAELAGNGDVAVRGNFGGLASG